MEYRMYYLVLRHLSGINKAVQTSHASIEYAVRYNNEPDFVKYSTIDKTIVMLDGGTHQDMKESQRILEENGIKHGYFLEPDINDVMTAICFLVDERIFNREYFIKYDSFCELYMDENGIIDTDINTYNEWIKHIGGKQNEIIYNLISGRKLST